MHITSLIAVLAVAVLAGRGSYAQEAGAAASLFSKLGARTVKSPIAIDCEVIHESSPMKWKSEERERRLGELRVQLMGPPELADRVDKASVEKMVQLVRQQYEKGAKSVERITLFLAPNYSALMHPQEGAQVGTRYVNWEVRNRDLYFELHDLNRTVTILDKGIHGQFRTRLDYLEQTKASIGLLGGLTDETLALNLKDAKLTVHGDVTRVDVGQHFLEVARRDHGTFDVKSFGHHSPKVPQSETTAFEDYRHFGELRMPALVTVKFANAEIATINTYKIPAVRDAVDERIPFINTEFGVVRVWDHRFAEEIVYMAASKLPSDALVAKWRADPVALRTHNETVKETEIAGGSKPHRASPSWLE